MTFAGWLEIALFLAVLTALTPLSAATWRACSPASSPRLGFVERRSTACSACDAERGQDWKGYARSALVFSALSFALLYLVLRTQGVHPFNPQDLSSGTWDVSFNTAASFVSNTNWQFYAGETTLSYFSQMFGLAVQNFASAAVGIAVLAAFIRGLASRSSSELGNFYVDLTRVLLYILLPLSVIAGLFLLSQGTLQSLGDYTTVKTLTGLDQTLAQGPVASQEAIKLLGTNGGGFFNVNSAMPFENPSWLTNFVQMLMILVIPAGLTATYGRMVGSRRQGWAVFAAMMALFVVAVALDLRRRESIRRRPWTPPGVTAPNLEGKEQRFGIASSSLFAAVTTAASCGAVNAAMESLTGLGGAVPMAEMMTGEVIWGGVGSGLYGMLLFVILGVFISGLMVGRTPEFLGKKIEAREIKLTVIGTIAVPMLVLVTTALAIGSKWGAPSIYNSGPQGFSETLYAYVSQGNNNGSAFAGYTGYLQPNGTNDGAFGISFADLLGGVAMLGGRFFPMLAALAIAGSLAGKRVSPTGLGTLRTDTPTFVVVLIAVILIVALLTFVPALLLGPDRPGPDRTALLAMREIRAAAVALVALSLVFGLAYPLAMTGIGQTVFGGPADGSLVKRDGKAVGSKLIGQDFSATRAARTMRASRSSRRPALLPEPPVRHGLQRRAPRSSTTSARTRRTSPTSCRPISSPTSPANGPRRRPARRDHPLRRRDHLGLGRGPGYLRGERAHPGHIASPGAAGSAAPGCSSWSTRTRAIRCSAWPAKARSTCSSSTSPSTGSPSDDRPARALAAAARHPPPRDSVVAGQARPAPGHPQPGHVRGRGRRRADDADLARPAVRR